VKNVNSHADTCVCIPVSYNETANISVNKSRAVVGKPCEAVQVSTCKASGKLHTGIYSDRQITIPLVMGHFLWVFL